jgi:hypothetical protein
MHLSGEWLAKHLSPLSNDLPNLRPRAEADQYLRPWSDEEDNPKDDVSPVLIGPSLNAPLWNQ